MADYWWFLRLPESVLVPSCVSSQGHSWRLSTHCSSSNYQLCPRAVFKPFCPSHRGRSLAEDRGTLPWPRGLSLCRAGSPKDLWTVPARRKSILLHPQGLTCSVQNLDDLSGNQQSTIIILVISSNQSPQIASLSKNEQYYFWTLICVGRSIVLQPVSWRSGWQRETGSAFGARTVTDGSWCSLPQPKLESYWWVHFSVTPSSCDEGIHRSHLVVPPVTS